MEAPSCRHDQSLTPFSALLKRMELGKKILGFYPWLGLSGDQLPFRSLPRVTSIESKLLLALLSLRNLQDQRWVKDQVLKQEMLLVLLSLEIFKSFRSPVSNCGLRQIYIFLIISHQVRPR